MASIFTRMASHCTTILDGRHGVVVVPQAFILRRLKPDLRGYVFSQSLCNTGLLLARRSALNHRNVFFIQKVFMSTPKIIQKKDPALEAVMEIDKKVRPVLQIRDMILKAQPEGILLKNVERRKRHLSLKASPLKPSTYVKRYPNIFEVYRNTVERAPYCRLTKEVLELMEEEKRIYSEQEPAAVERLRKLLMMLSGRKILVSKIEAVRRDFGFAHNFLVDMVPKYPEFFRILKNDNGREVLELVNWDESLAISAFERKAKEEARKKGLGEIETRGRPLAFQVSFSPGMFLRRRIVELLEEWQTVPYISPYQDASSLKHGTSLLEKRNVAVLHELLWLTIEKKAQLSVISNFRAELGLPNKPPKLINRYPGIFYVSHKGAVETCILREGYQGSELVEESPFAQLKAKYAQMVYDGPRLLAKMKEKKDENDGDKLVSETELYKDGPTEDDINKEDEETGNSTVGGDSDDGSNGDEEEFDDDTDEGDSDDCIVNERMRGLRGTSH